jgi:hypothetical protein
MKKKTKLFLGFVGLLVAAFIFYVYKLHSLALEGNEIFGQRCATVNPSLIAYKNNFLDFTDEVKKGEKSNPEYIYGYFQAYINEVRNYAPKEVEWLKTQRAFLDRWDFQLFEPWYIKEAAEYQYRMYEGYRDEALALLKIIEDHEKKPETQEMFDNARNKRNENSYLYFELSKRASEFRDWRKIFGSVPMPEGCTEELLNIPDTTGALDPDPIEVPVTNPGVTG